MSLCKKEKKKKKYKRDFFMCVSVVKTAGRKYLAKNVF